MKLHLLWLTVVAYRSGPPLGRHRLSGGMLMYVIRVVINSMREIRAKSWALNLITMLAYFELIHIHWSVHEQVRTRVRINHPKQICDFNSIQVQIQIKLNLNFNISHSIENIASVLVKDNTGQVQNRTIHWLMIWACSPWRVNAKVQLYELN